MSSIPCGVLAALSMDSGILNKILANFTLRGGGLGGGTPQRVSLSKGQNGSMAGESLSAKATAPHPIAIGPLLRRIEVLARTVEAF